MLQPMMCPKCGKELTMINLRSHICHPPSPIGSQDLEIQTDRSGSNLPLIASGNHEAVNLFLAAKCDEVTHHKGPVPLAVLGGRHYEVTYYWFHLDEDEDGRTAAVRVAAMDPQGDYVEVDVVNRQSGPDKTEDGKATVGFCYDMETLMEFIQAGVKLAMPKSKLVS